MRIDESVLKVLDAAEVDGQGVRLVGQLDRKLYLDVNKVLECAGGKWNRKARAHLFEDDPAGIIEAMIFTGEITNAKQELGFFPTPPDVIARMIDLAGIQAGMMVLEPSAGSGDLARELSKTATVDCFEIEKAHVTKWAADGTARNIWIGDFLAAMPGDYLGAIYDRVVMNPPFAKQADLRHAAHALGFLKLGGVLVSVLSAGIMFRENRMAVDFRSMVYARGGSFHELPEGAFKDSGTMVRAVLVRIAKK